MKRNPEDEPEQVVRFSRTNPPPSDEIALQRTDVLDETVTLIETQLEHNSPNSFASDEEYEAWRRRATDALGFARTERRFLRKWVTNRTREAEEAAQRKEKKAQDAARAKQREEMQKSHPEVGLIIAQVKARVKELAEEIGRDYAPVYTATSLPENMTAADERLAQLGAIKFRLQGAFAEVGAAWSEHQLHPRILPGVKSPLSKILIKVETELLVLRGFIRTNQAARIDWKPLCFRALERAIASGFQLTPEEQAVFDQMRPLQR